MLKLNFFVVIWVTLSILVIENLADTNCPCAVNFIYSPVCGDNGKTFTNSGEIDCYNKCHGTNITVVAREPCSCNCPLFKDYRPLCASNGKSYINRSALNCHNKCNYPPITPVHWQACNKDDELLRN